MKQRGANVFNLKIRRRKRINMYVGKIVDTEDEETGKIYLAQITAINKVVIVDGEVMFDLDVVVMD